MLINADFTERVVVRPGDVPWVASPIAGVDRRMLDRVGGEVARATSFVRYAPDSRFPAHTHGGGEEFLVLEGVFFDEQGAYPAGHYVRNPIESRHAPYTKEGCTIFVKLRQFDAGDRQRVVIDTRKAAWQAGGAAGVSILPLHAFGEERVALERWAPGTRIVAHEHGGGEEIVVIEGAFADEFGAYPAGTWIRTPHGSRHAPASESGCLLYVKAGHLRENAREP
ncbi:MAG TPA: cupin domain-containing protein [Usitatibacter sp.]|nr:cupin domain-containing protein [Usitatibacter sp.]